MKSRKYSNFYAATFVRIKTAPGRLSVCKLSTKTECRQGQSGWQASGGNWTYRDAAQAIGAPREQASEAEPRRLLPVVTPSTPYPERGTKNLTLTPYRSYNNNSKKKKKINDVSYSQRSTQVTREKSLNDRIILWNVFFFLFTLGRLWL